MQLSEIFRLSWVYKAWCAYYGHQDDSATIRLDELVAITSQISPHEQHELLRTIDYFSDL